MRISNLLRPIQRALIVLIILAPSTNALATKEEFLSDEVNDEFVKQSVNVTNTLFPTGRLADGSPPGPVTEVEERLGVIPLDTAQRIVRLAVDTAFAEYCGLDWAQISFLPIMKRERAEGRWSDRQIAYIGMLHGFVQGSYRELSKKFEPCNANQKRAVEKFFTEKHW